MVEVRQTPIDKVLRPTKKEIEERLANKANSVIDIAEKKLKEYSKKIPSELKSSIENNIKLLKQIIAGKKFEEITARTGALETSIALGDEAYKKQQNSDNFNNDQDTQKIINSLKNEKEACAKNLQNEKENSSKVLQDKQSEFDSKLKYEQEKYETDLKREKENLAKVLQDKQSEFDSKLKHEQEKYETDLKREKENSAKVLQGKQSEFDSKLKYEQEKYTTSIAKFNIVIKKLEEKIGEAQNFEEKLLQIGQANIKTLAHIISNRNINYEFRINAYNMIKAKCTLNIESCIGGEIVEITHDNNRKSNFCCKYEQFAGNIIDINDAEWVIAS